MKCSDFQRKEKEAMAKKQKADEIPEEEAFKRVKDEFVKLSGLEQNKYLDVAKRYAKKQRQ